MIHPFSASLAEGICAMRKDELRREIRRQKQLFTTAQLEDLSQPVIARLRERLADAQTIFAYYSLPDEVCTHQLLDDLVVEGKTVLLPKMLDQTTMELRRYTGRDDLREGPLHVMEPIGEPFTDYSQIDIALIPGVAFDAEGHRLGRGRGYYDRFLRTIGTVPFVRMGVCFDFQKVDSVPHDANDVSVDMVI